MGTTSVEISELLSKMLKMRNIPHQVLNAKLHQKEAQIVALAGQSTNGKGAVTIATNMAGRGTDIKLSPEVKAAGGLAIIGTGATRAAVSTVSCVVVQDVRATRDHRYSTYRSRISSCDSSVLSALHASWTAWDSRTVSVSSRR